MCLSFTADPDLPAPPSSPPPFQKSKKMIQKCVYGYTGSFDNAIKPILLLYLVGSCLGTLVFAALNKDGTRPFMLSTCGHLLTEVITWTHILFPPATTKQNHQWMWRIRSVYLVGAAVLAFAPSQKVVTATYMIMSGVSDFLAFWMGLVFVANRTHHGARRLGLAFLVHGAGFHLAAFEFFGGTSPNDLLWGDDHPKMKGFSWMVLLLSTTAAFLTVPSLFQQPLDLRYETPTLKERKFMAAGVATSFMVMPAWGAGSRAKALEILPELLARPAFLPQEKSVLFVYKMITPISGLILSLYVLQCYMDAGLPILPVTNDKAPKKCPFQ